MLIRRHPFSNRHSNRALQHKTLRPVFKPGFTLLDAEKEGRREVKPKPGRKRKPELDDVVKHGRYELFSNDRPPAAKPTTMRTGRVG